jgi:hypothetical protein
LAFPPRFPLGLSMREGVSATSGSRSRPFPDSTHRRSTRGVLPNMMQSVARSPDLQSILQKELYCMQDGVCCTCAGVQVQEFGSMDCPIQVRLKGV